MDVNAWPCAEASLGHHFCKPLSFTLLSSLGGASQAQDTFAMQTSQHNGSTDLRILGREVFEYSHHKEMKNA